MGWEKIRINPAMNEADMLPINECIKVGVLDVPASASLRRF